MSGLFAEMPPVMLGPGITLFPGLAPPSLLSAAMALLVAAPPRQVWTPGGRPLSVVMTNCGTLGWISDRAGYRYAATEPQTGCPWPAMPDEFLGLAQRAAGLAGFPDFVPDACLVNLYRPGARMGLHQDRDEADFTQPIVSVSLGCAALFRLGGTSRSDPTRSLRLDHADILVFGGPARLMFHGIDRLLPVPHPILGGERINLTFRRAGALVPA